MGIDVIVRRRIGPLEAGARLKISQPDGVENIQVAAQDGHLTGGMELDQARVADLGNARIAAREDGKPGHIANAAVGEGCLHGQLLPAGRLLQNARAGQDFDGLHRGKSCRIVLQALLEPGAERLGRDARRQKALAPLVWHAAQRLLQDQTLCGVVAIGAAAHHVASQLQIVGRRVKPAQAELEARFAAGCAMAGARVATTHVERGHDFIAKADQVRFIHVGDFDRRLGGLASHLDD